MREIGFTSKVFTPHSIVGQLSGGERQGVAIARAIYKQAELIILDEPTTALSLTETAKVFHFVRQVRASGRSILFIGHNIHHVFDIADRFVVLDRGKVALDRRPQRGQVGRGADQLHGRRRAPRRTGRAARRRRRGAAQRDEQDHGTRSAEPARRRRQRRTEWNHPSDHWLRGFVIDNRASLGTLAVFIVMMAVFMIANPTRVHHLVPLQLGADDAAGGAVRGGAAGLRRHLRRDRPVVSGDDGLCRPGCSRWWCRPATIRSSALPRRSSPACCSASSSARWSSMAGCRR